MAEPAPSTDAPQAEGPPPSAWASPRPRHGVRSRVDVAIVGAGIIGLTTARALSVARPDLRLAIIEKEPVIARHQTGSNSGVIHSGIYYKPGSLKARLTVEGKAELERYCTERGVPFERCGKVVVATRTEELAQLDVLAGRAEANGVPAERISVSRLAELEPHAVGLGALHVRSTGIVDYPVLCDWLADELRQADHEIRLGHAVTGVAEEDQQVVVATHGDYAHARVLINCAGLHSDRVARLSTLSGTEVRIMPFRGEYFSLVPARRHLVNNLIYPVPDPRFPFLGVHFTRMVKGGVEAGPNAVPALAREGYRWGDIDRADLREILTARSSRILARNFWRTGLSEIHRSLSKKAFVRALQALVPEVREEDLVRTGAGVRAQAIGPDGALLDDFAFSETARQIHVVNAPSPAATASFAIGRIIAAKALERLD
ncbi:MAG: L-2-hydroxyglutarate oxidase [Acidimicrobiales bacterium]